MKCSFFRRVVRQGQSGVGLGDAERGNFGKIEAFGNHLGADNNVVVAGVDLVVNVGELLGGVGVGVEANDASGWEEPAEFGFEHFGAEAFMVNAGIAAFGASGGYGIGTATSVAAHLEFISMENERQEAGVAEGLPAAMVADGERGGAATVMKNHGLGVVVERVLNAF